MFNIAKLDITHKYTFMAWYRHFDKKRGGVKLVAWSKISNITE